MTEPASVAAGGFALAKVLGAGAALLTAMCIAAARPPKTKQELFVRAFVAITTSVLFGGVAVAAADFYIPFIDVASSVFSEFHAAVHGVVGGAAWFVWGGIAETLNEFKTKPLEFLTSVKNLFLPK